MSYNAQSLRRRTRDGGMEDVRALEDGQGGEVAAEGPPTDAHPAQVEGLGERLRRSLEPAHLTLEGRTGDVEAHLPLPGAARPGVPWPSATTTAKPWSAIHWAPR